MLMPYSIRVDVYISISWPNTWCDEHWWIFNFGNQRNFMEQVWGDNRSSLSSPSASRLLGFAASIATFAWRPFNIVIVTLMVKYTSASMSLCRGEIIYCLLIRDAHYGPREKLIIRHRYGSVPPFRQPKELLIDDEIVIRNSMRPS